MGLNMAPKSTNEVMKVAELMKCAAEYNPRHISKPALRGLRKSIRRYGMVQPIVFNKRSKKTVGGHQRVIAADLEKLAEVPVIVVDLSPAEEKALNIALNNPNIAGEFTDDLQALLEEISREDIDLFEDLRLDELLKDDDASSSEGGTGGSGDGPFCKPGDEWILGDHTLTCGTADLAQCDSIVKHWESQTGEKAKRAK